MPGKAQREGARKECCATAPASSGKDLPAMGRIKLALSTALAVALSLAAAAIAFADGGGGWLPR